ncbi:class I SAM-dependent methyltransferase [Thioclava sp. FR2]|uniref:class I SAM-dependent methyltransferase n=1 Tax=Thioclava sp. FR2 TaxID=3445780 RepID=UPI003EBFDCE5
MAQPSRTRKSIKTAIPVEIPSMIGKVDIDLLEKHLSSLPPDAVILEFGPWLGSVTSRLAAHGHVHVVDNFLWTSDHAKKVPGLTEAGQSFRSFFEKNMQSRNHSVTVHETDMLDFEWSGGPIDFCMIDAPKTPEMALAVLKKLQGNVKPETIVLFKNALSASIPDLVLMVHQLLDAGAIVRSDIPAHKNCNTLAFRPGPEFDHLDAHAKQSLVSAPATGSTEGSVVVQVASMIQHIGNGNWIGAYELLSDMPQDPNSIVIWDAAAKRLMVRDVPTDRLDLFNEMFSFHHTSLGTQPGAINMARSLAHMMRAYWVNNSDKPWRGQCFQPALMEQALSYGYIKWPEKIQELVRGKDVLDVGCGSGLHGIGYLAAGAKSYFGIDPIINLDKDRVKNLTEKTKEAFGWTPREIAALLHPWKITPEPIQSLPNERNFDIATLHNVTEHLLQIDEVFQAIASRLREGGKIFYNHQNFYAWNGHNLSPKSLNAIDPKNIEQKDYIDWAHIAYEPDPTHYIARGLNRIRLDDILEVTSRYFDIETSEEIPTQPENGGLRLTDEIRARYPNLTDRDFLTQKLVVTARVKI